MRYFLAFVCKNVSFERTLKFQDLNVIRERKKSNTYVNLSFINKLFIKIASFLLNTMSKSESCILCISCLRNNNCCRSNIFSRIFIRIVAFYNYKQLLINKDVI